DLVERGPHAVASEVDHPALDHLLRARGVRRAQGLVEEERVLARREQAPEALLRLARELVQGPAGLDEGLDGRVDVHARAEALKLLFPARGLDQRGLGARDGSLAAPCL